MDFTFNVEVAEKYGVSEAVFIQHIFFWTRKNEANDKHFYDGRYWTYNSIEAFVNLFPFWSKRQVRRIIDKLKASGAIYIGNFNQKSFDRTQWYALSDDVISICQKGHMEVTKRAHGSDRKGTTIPDSKPYSKPYIPPISPTGDEVRLKESNFDLFWTAYPKKVGKAAAKKAFAKVKVNINTLISAVEQQKQSDQWRKDNGQYIPNPTTWLNQGRWDDELSGIDKPVEQAKPKKYREVVINGETILEVIADAE